MNPCLRRKASWKLERFVVVVVIVFLECPTTTCLHALSLTLIEGRCDFQEIGIISQQGECPAREVDGMEDKFIRQSASFPSSASSKTSAMESRGSRCGYGIGGGTKQMRC